MKKTRPDRDGGKWWQPVRTPKSNVWSRISDWIDSDYETDSDIAAALHALFQIEQARQDDGAKSSAGKLSSKWGAWRVHFPGLIKIINEYADGKIIGPVAPGTSPPKPPNPHSIKSTISRFPDNTGEGYQITLIGDPSDFLYDQVKVRGVKGGVVKGFEGTRAVFATMIGDPILEGVLVANADYVRESVIPDEEYDDIMEGLGAPPSNVDVGEDGDFYWHETLAVLNKAFDHKEIAKHLICVKRAPDAVVMTRAAYDFCNYYLQHVAKINDRIPSRNDPSIMRKHFKVPTTMKNFRFDISNVRGLEAATALTNESFVYFINQLLKKYLGLEVAAKLESLKYTGEPNEQLSPQGAEEIFERFRRQTAGFGFDVPKNLKAALNDPKLMIEELELKLQAEKVSNEASRTRSAENLLTAEEATKSAAYYKELAKGQENTIANLEEKVKSLEQKLELAKVVKVSDLPPLPKIDKDGIVEFETSNDDIVGETVALGDRMDDSMADLYDKISTKIDSKLDSFIKKFKISDWKKMSADAERFVADDELSVEERTEKAMKWLNEGTLREGKGVYYDASFPDMGTFEIDWELPREELKQRFSDWLKNKPTKSSRVSAAEFDKAIKDAPPYQELTEEELESLPRGLRPTKPKAKRKAKKKK